MNPFISKLQRYAHLADDEVAALRRATAASKKVGARVDLIREGDRPGPVLVMLEGWAVRYKILPGGSRQIMAFLMPGDACDLHVGMLAEMDHSIQTLTAARVAAISGPDMTAMMKAHVGIAQAMYIAQLADEGTLRSWIISMGRRSSMERVAHLICEIYVRGHWTSVSKDELELPMSQTVLADALGMTPVHINRMLKELRESGLVAMRRGCITILKPAELAATAGFDENYLHRRMRNAS